ncbi:MAG: peptidoglycan-binding protein [Tistlia sp.]|uniref:ZIP family metal transporter n=1 Tax=Tistlia sp. TaxID=3057121 RepID=UPI0034A1649B
MTASGSGFLLLLGYALLPAIGNLVGVALAEWVRTPRWAIGAALHAAAGIAIALVAVDLMPRVLDTLPMWVTVACFLLGAAFSLLLWLGVGALRSRFGGARGTALMVYVAIGADLFSDGLLVGAGSAVSGGLGLLIGATQTVANIPGGFAATRNMQEEGTPRGRRWLLGLLLFLPVLASASIGYWLLGDRSTFVQSAALAFVVGVLLLATIEDMVPEADRPQAARWVSTLSFAAGFAGLSLIAGYVD